VDPEVKWITKQFFKCVQDTAYQDGNKLKLPVTANKTKVSPENNMNGVEPHREAVSKEQAEAHDL
jgi:hypothetical protein